MADDVGRNYAEHQKPMRDHQNERRAAALARHTRVEVQAYAPEDRIESLKWYVRNNHRDLYDILFKYMPELEREAKYSESGNIFS